MSLMRVDWNPSDKKVRQFGALLAAFAALSGWSMMRHGRPAGPGVLKAGVALGLACALIPPLGRRVYKVWMAAAFVIGTPASYVLLAFTYYVVLTPLALFFRLRGRDVLRLSKPVGETYWTPVVPAAPEDYERLF